QDKQVDGVVITFIDISNVKQLDNIIKGVFNSSISAIMAFKAVRNKEKQVTDLVWITANYASDELLQLSEAEYTGKSIREKFPELLKNGFFENCVEVISSGKPLHKEMQLNFHNRLQWFEVVATQMGDGLVITFTNINEKKEAEEKFRRNYYELMKVKESYRNLNVELEEKVKERTFELSQGEERFRLIANATNDAIWDWDLVNNEIWWSESFYTKFGYEKKDGTLSSSFWMEHIHPDDQEAVSEGIHEAINNGTSDWSTRYRFRKADGSYATIFDKGAVLLDSNNTPYRMVGAMMDITEAEISQMQLTEKNRELESLFSEFKFVTDFMPQMVWSTRANGDHDFYNKGWFDYTGLTYESSKNQGWSLVLHPDDYERTIKIWEASLRTGKTYETEYRMRRHDGVYRWFLARAIPLKDEEGRIIKWFGTCTDIHDQKLMSDILELKVRERTDELQKMNLELEASNNELLQFASVASHDLKEPLRKIHMFSNLIKDRYLGEANQGALDYMDRIIKASARMTKLINDLLTFTRLSVNSTFENTSLNLIVEEVLSDLELTIHEKNAVIEVDKMPVADIVTGQMRQVFQNIISNALKFVRQDVRPHIRITSELISSCAMDAKPFQHGEFVRITITDNGIGFDNQYADKIFTIFQRLHAREQYDGTGIGLAITRKIVERHNGMITAVSREGHGTSFILVLPLKQQADVERSPQALKALS
ncbi:MAG TPA: PAS domain-containing protein, partial [Flavisolibacter sp.]|nr:PAS domain-containing protein [Flavisolibacter sp.]